MAKICTNIGALALFAGVAISFVWMPALLLLAVPGFILAVVGRMMA